MDQMLCPICSSPCKVFSESRRCTACGVVRTNYDYDSSIYNSGYAECYVEYQKTPVNVPLSLFRLGLVSRWLKERDYILDIGCGIAEFIRFAEPYYVCYGFEPNKIAVNITKKRVNSKVYEFLNGSIPRVNLITMFDVLEHIEDPEEFLVLLSGAYLRDKGVIVVTTPNVDAIPLCDEDGLHRWKHYKPHEHLFLHTEESLEIMFKRRGFECVHVGKEESDIRPGNPNGDILTFVARKV
jgi:2-polyprenyl-3-methyl-5-hydroxy-6-metoxy-1,4-benzoquinol methylase